MIFHLNEETPEVLPHFKGGEGNFIAKIHFDGVNKIIHGTLPPGATIGKHTHEGNSEIIYILSGTATVDDDGVLHPLQAGDCTYCPEGHAHSLMNTGKEDLVFFAVVPQQNETAPV